MAPHRVNCTSKALGSSQVKTHLNLHHAAMPRCLTVIDVAGRCKGAPSWRSL